MKFDRRIYKNKYHLNKINNFIASNGRREHEVAKNVHTQKYLKVDNIFSLKTN